MTNINIYCLFDDADELYGVYSSIKAVHRDAIKICNQGTSAVYLKQGADISKASLPALRNLFKGAMDVKTQYVSDVRRVTILKTSLKE